MMALRLSRNDDLMESQGSISEKNIFMFSTHQIIKCRIVDGQTVANDNLMNKI